jgi:hypothetical protein
MERVRERACCLLELAIGPMHQHAGRTSRGMWSADGVQAERSRIVWFGRLAFAPSSLDASTLRGKKLLSFIPYYLATGGKLGRPRFAWDGPAV